jgi:hypothetical protein
MTFINKIIQSINDSLTRTHTHTHAHTHTQLEFYFRSCNTTFLDQIITHCIIIDASNEEYGIIVEEPERDIRG